MHDTIFRLVLPTVTGSVRRSPHNNPPGTVTWGGGGSEHRAGLAFQKAKARALLDTGYEPLVLIVAGTTRAQ